MRKMYCKKCDDYTPHKYCGHENDFDEVELDKALNSYQKRQRRFGGLV